MKNRENKKKQGSFFYNLPDIIKDSINPGKSELLSDKIEEGVGNYLLFRKYPCYRWPLWLFEATKDNSAGRRVQSFPLLSNSNLREWRPFNNFMTAGSIRVDRSGMISGPGNAPWSLEIWLYHRGALTRPCENPENVDALLDSETGEIIISFTKGEISFNQRIAGARSTVDEALVEIDLNVRKVSDDTMLFFVLRPYNSQSLGGLKSADFIKEEKILKINGLKQAAADTMPDRIIAGSAKLGDISIDSEDDFSTHVFCDAGMASSALGYSLKQGKSRFYFRVSLNSGAELSPIQVKYEEAFNDFREYSAVRIGEGIKIFLEDRKFLTRFRRSLFTILTLSKGVEAQTVENYRDMFFYVHAMNRAGFDRDCEIMITGFLENSEFNLKNKNKNLDDVIRGAYLIGAFADYHVHKRDSEFLHKHFSVLRQACEYIYSWSSGIHSVEGLSPSTSGKVVENRADEYDFLIISHALSNMSLLARWMGIFGDEKKFKTESDRIQAVVRDFIRNRKGGACSPAGLGSLTALHERILNIVSDEEYEDMFKGLFAASSYIAADGLSGIDLGASTSLLNQLLHMKDPVFGECSRKLFGFMDDFFVLPEYIDPVSGRGCSGEGFSGAINSQLFITMRNMLFTDRNDRLELFPVPMPEWFREGRKVRVENAPSRFGVLSFSAERMEKEIRLEFHELPKYVPSDIRISFPFETDIVYADDFILKKKSGNSYLINGWPSVIRFPISP